MAEAGSFADRVKQQADIVRVVGEYVRLKKSGQNFTGLCPFHGEKTPSFAVHPVKQIFHCFGCGKGGDVFSFVMEMEKCPFPEAVRMVAEKCGIAIPKPKASSPEERKENQQRAALMEMHREAQAFFVKQLESTPEGRAPKRIWKIVGWTRKQLRDLASAMRRGRRKSATRIEAQVRGSAAGRVRINFARFPSFMMRAKSSMEAAYCMALRARTNSGIPLGS